MTLTGVYRIYFELALLDTKHPKTGNVILDAIEY